jgi:hypothetical protein
MTNDPFVFFKIKEARRKKLRGKIGILGLAAWENVGISLLKRTNPTIFLIQ